MAFMTNTQTKMVMAKVVPSKGVNNYAVEVVKKLQEGHPNLIDHPIDGLMLAASHAVGVNAYIDIEVATFLAGFLLEYYPVLLKARYGFLTQGSDAVAVIEAIAKRRGCIIKGRGGEPDLEKAAAILLVDYRSGALGRISLETPTLRAARASALEQPVVPQGDFVPGAVDSEKD